MSLDKHITADPAFLCCLGSLAQQRQFGKAEVSLQNKHHGQVTHGDSLCLSLYVKGAYWVDFPSDHKSQPQADWNKRYPIKAIPSAGSLKSHVHIYGR